MERNRRYFSGHTVQQALMRAASHYGCAPEELAWKEVEKRHGFLKVRRGVIIEIDPEAPRREEAAERASDAPISVPSRPTPPPPPAALRPEEEPQPAPKPAPEAHTPEGGSREGESVREEAPGRESPPAAAEPAGAGEEEGSTERPWWAMPPAPAPQEAEPTGSDTRERREGEGEVLPRRRRSRGGRSRRARRGGASAAGESARGEITELPGAPASPGERWARAAGERAESARRWTGELLALAGLELDIELFDADDELLVELTGKHRELAVADRGRVLLAIQHLLPRLMRTDLGETPSVRVDSESFQDIREETLRDLAQRAADRVRENRRPWLLEPMAPDERRIVHLTLADDPAVTTESLGEGYFKRVRVQLERGRS